MNPIIQLLHLIFRLALDMVLDRIIELEDKVIRSKKRLPRVLKINYQSYVSLIKELETNQYLSEIHGMAIQIIPLNRIIVE